MELDALFYELTRMSFGKSCFAKKLLFSIFVLLVLVPTTSPSFGINDDECDDVIDQEIERVTNSLDENKMKEAVLNDSQFREMTQHSKKIEFSNIMQNWSVPEGDCIPILENNQVKFNLDKGTENHKTVSVFLNPSNVVLSRIIDDPPPSHGSGAKGFNPANYEEPDPALREDDDQLTPGELEGSVIIFDGIGVIVIAIVGAVGGILILVLILRQKKIIGLCNP